MPTSRVYDKLCLHYDNGKWKRKSAYMLLPRREKWFYYRRGSHLLLLHWKPFAGIWLHAERVGDDSAEPHTITLRSDYPMAVKKRQPKDLTGTGLPSASPTSVLLAKLPALREWLTATTYEDGTARNPGKLSVETYGVTWSILLRDPDAGLRLNVRAPELDKALLLVEQLLGVEEAPWERDEWLTAQLAKKGKKK